MYRKKKGRVKKKATRLEKLATKKHFPNAIVLVGSADPTTIRVFETAAKTRNYLGVKNPSTFYDVRTCLVTWEVRRRRRGGGLWDLFGLWRGDDCHFNFVTLLGSFLTDSVPPTPTPTPAPCDVLTCIVPVLIGC